MSTFFSRGILQPCKIKGDRQNVKKTKYVLWLYNSSHMYAQLTVTAKYVFDTFLSGVFGKQ